MRRLNLQNALAHPPYKLINDWRVELSRFLEPMTIQQLTVEQKRLSPTEAELWILVQVEKIDSDFELHGSLTGPHCANHQTIQLAYPLKPIFPTGYPSNVLVGRIIIPEPNLWTSATPFYYEGTVQLWHDGVLQATQAIRASFKAK